MTGRRAGYCAGYAVPGYAHPMPGGGFGMGWGRGRRGGWGRGMGWRHWYHVTGLPGWVRFGYGPAWGLLPFAAYGSYAAPSAPEQEVEFLREQAEWLKGELDGISQRIAELEQEK
jgi:hypothetical protein